jgi:Trypsin
MANFSLLLLFHAIISYLFNNKDKIRRKFPTQFCSISRRASSTMSSMWFLAKLLFTSAILLSHQGVKCQEVEPRIVGGFNVSSINGFRHQVSIRKVSSERIFGNGHICGGSLISYRAVLTAGKKLITIGDSSI